MPHYSETAMTKYYITRLYDFLRRLARHNDREWFAAHKAEFDELRAMWMQDLDRLIAMMTAWEPELAGQSAKTSAYRFYRDTRFSQDKSPYKLYLSAAITPWGRKTDMAGYYLHIGLPGVLTPSGMYGGIWMPETPILKKLRHAIVDNIEEWEEIVNAPALVAAAPGWCGDALKTIPKGWERDHPQAEFLRLKEYGKFIPGDEAFFSSPSWVERAAEAFHLFKPMIDFLNYSITEEL